MNGAKMKTLSETINSLVMEGFTEDFNIKEDKVISNTSDKKYDPEDLVIVKTFRFEGMSNPADSSELFAIEAKDGVKGTLVISFGAKHSKDVELVKKIKMA